MSTATKEQPYRRALRSTHRVLIKAGTSVVANNDGRPSLTRLGAIVEQVAELHRSGMEVIMVTSGATGMGRRLMRKHGRMNMTMAEMTSSNDLTDLTEGVQDVTLRSESNFLDDGGLTMGDPALSEKDSQKTFQSACAAGGQFEMMSLYNSLFSQMDISAAQILLTEGDFRDESHLTSLMYSIERLLSVGIIPIINENDAVTANRGTADDSHLFTDNDSLAALCARSFSCDMCILLTDVDGVFDRPPSEKGSKLLPFYAQNQSVGIGEKSLHGRGGMAAKISAAQMAVKPGSQCRACVVLSGADLDSIRSVVSKEYEIDDNAGPKGTLFATPGSELEKQALEDVEAITGDSVSEVASLMATSSRDQARKLQNLSHSERQAILYAVADALETEKETILAANAIDLENAEKDGTALPLVRRLKLTDAKLATLSTGIRQIADQPDPLGVVKAKRELANGLELSQITVPIGVLMIIFESRPDSMPQIAALALASGNGLLLKGGKEAAYSNEAIHRVIGDAIEKGSGGKITRDIIALVTSRGQVADMLKLDDVVDLVIPRGSNALVSYIKANTRIPVLGHADGVCHVYVDKSCTDASLVSKLVVDAKTDYPSACNAMETLLLHKDTLQTHIAMSVLMSLRVAGVKCLGGPKAMKTGLCDIAAKEMKCEYGDLTCMVEIVENMEEAIDWIHKYGSGHTEAIVCAEDSEAGEEFLNRVDAACVFKNASTRFADGYRFGLGAEVGISTGRIHARGPVGVEGLLTVKWQLRSEGINIASEYEGDDRQKVYTHKDIM